MKQMQLLATAFQGSQIAHPRAIAIPSRRLTAGIQALERRPNLSIEHCAGENFLQAHNLHPRQLQVRPLPSALIPLSMAMGLAAFITCMCYTWCTQRFV